ncbi:MAG TPA: ligase-associated DNA damage response exonuclease [Pirellulales bacterium]|nr:ligase-associated DNA damage response exonuclease [Pirellulales bacterium]
MADLLTLTDRGLYSPQGDFYIDPWLPVERAVITHAHADHARPGSQGYLTATSGVDLVRERVGPDAAVEGLPYGEPREINGVRLSLHPAGHMLGSAQVRLELGGQVWVVTGDYKTAADNTCEPMEPLACHTLVTESTFGLPIFRWRPAGELFADIDQWWRTAQERGRTCVIYAYALGKAQRLLAGLDATFGPILVHGAIERFLPAYEKQGVRLPVTERATDENARATRGRAMVVAPPSAANSPWLKKFGPVSPAVASGWMQIRGTRRRKAVDRGFALSDHADWDGLLTVIRESRAEQVWVTHGYTSAMVRWLQEQGIAARALQTRFEGELDEEAEKGAANQESDA